MRVVARPAGKGMMVDLADPNPARPEASRDAAVSVEFVCGRCGRAVFSCPENDPPPRSVVFECTQCGACNVAGGVLN
jgi:hypothetical protein